ncbi:hypothetical protein A4G20_06755 [Pasteurellaceae bacterium RH1A]|nr:hypothetical protein A4G20_06755 [Pasteurellaceae bacterium RH1A]
MNFNQSLSQQLAFFRPYEQETVTTAPQAFNQTRAKVADFIREIQVTAALLSQAEQAELAEFYADKLLRQFKALQQAVEKHQKFANQLKATRPSFQSNFRFPRNIHNLPNDKKLAEYKKALRALNEKISWIMEQNYQASEPDKAFWQEQLQETEYRKFKCLAAIEALE